MFALRKTYIGRLALVTAVVAMVGAMASAQEDDNDNDDEEVIEEIVVYGGDKPGDPVDFDALYEAAKRDMLRIDMDRLREMQDELEWRATTDKTINADSSSRIKWGYNPNDELQMRNDLDMTDVQGQTTKPATVFRFEF